MPVHWRSLFYTMACVVWLVTQPALLQGQPSGRYSIAGGVFGPDGTALRFSTVSVREIGTERFATARGEFRFGGLVAGTYHLRIRQLAYVARDTVVVLGPTVSADFLRVTLSPIAFRLAKVVVRAKSGRCTVSGTRASESDPDVAAILTEISKNAEREVLIRTNYPFEYTLAQRFDRPDINGPAHNITESEETYDSRASWTYRPGRVVEDDSSSGDSYTRLMHTPALPHLADPGFQAAHCYAYQGIVNDRGSKAHRIDFRPLDTISTPDVEGSVFLDEASFLVRRVDFKLTRPEGLSPPILGLSSKTIYREILPRVALIDEIDAVQPIKQWTTGEQGADITQTQKLTRFRFLNGAPGDSIFPVSRQSVRPDAAGSLLTGVAIDSIWGGYLRGAILSVVGTNRHATSDSAGRFRIDGIPAGEHAIKISHPLLDTLAISVTTAPRLFSGTDSVFVFVGTPSRASIVASKCSATDRAGGPAAVIGTVFDADTEAPSVGAQVMLEWVDHMIRDKTIQSVRQRKVATVREDGAFKICGVPDDLVAGLVAYRQADTTAAVAANLRSQLAIVSFHLPPSAQSLGRTPSEEVGAFGRRSSQGTVTGRILDGAGKQLSGARVAFDSDGAVTLSSSDGSFQLSGLRVGTRRLDVRFLGYQPVDTTIDISSRMARPLTILLKKSVPVLKAVEITAPAGAGLQKVGFAERRRLRNGVYLGPKEIARRNSPRLSRLLETTTVIGRYKCVRYFVDGQRWSRLSDDDPSLGPDNYLSGAELAAVEVYSPNTAPGEFFALDRNGVPCASVVVWTKWKVMP